MNIKIKITTAILMLFSGGYCFSQSTIVEDSISLPSIYIETIDNEEPTCEMIVHPEGSFGVGITNNNKVPGRIIIKQANDTLYDSGHYIEGEAGMTIRVRGNTSAGYDKKSFKIKLQNSYDLLFRDAPSYYDKDWILLRSGGKLLTTTGFLVNSIVNNNSWTPEYKHVNLFLNDDYRGVYILLESIEREKNCRIYVDKTEGYIFELDPYWWNEDLYFDTSFTDATKRFTFKYPDSDEVTLGQIEYLKAYLEKAEEAINNGNYSDYIDVESFARWILAHDILGTWDSAGSNIFLIKKDNSSKIEMATLWDFDTALQTTNNWARVHYDYFYYSMLFNNINKEFVRMYKSIWEEVNKGDYDSIIEALTAFPDSNEGIALNESISQDNARWDYSNPSVTEQIEETIDWLIHRKEWLDTAIDNLDDADNYNNINAPKIESDNEATIYDIYGRKTEQPQRGIYIINGKKYLIH